MRESIKQFVDIVAKSLPINEPIFEFGALQVPGQEGFADLRPFFSGKEYVGCDMREGPGVDRILDLHHVDLPSETVGTVLILDTLEHVEYCREAMEETYRILCSGGLAIVSSVLNYPIHEYPSDYWRFTPEGLRSLLKVFPFSLVNALGDEEFPHTVVGVGAKGSLPKASLDRFMERFDAWKRYWIDPPPPKPPRSWETVVKAFSPPILLALYRKMRGSAR